MEILNLEELAQKEFGDNEPVPDREWWVPKGSKRAIISGCSGSGKTNVLANLIIQNKLVYDKIWLFCRGVEDDLKYKLVIKHVCELADQYKEDCETDQDPDMIFVSSDINDVPSPEDIEMGKHHLFIFDDQMMEKDQSKVEELFVRGRRRIGMGNIVYICQDYYQVSKVIRKNTDILLCFREMSERSKSQIGYEHSGTMPMSEFKEMYDNVMNSSKYPFLMIDKTVPDSDPKHFRNGFTDLYVRQKK